MIIKTSAFTRLKTNDFIPYARNCVNRVSASPHLFPNLQPSPAVVMEAVNSLESKVSHASSRILKDERDAQRKILTTYLVLWTGQVCAIASMMPSRQMARSIVTAAGFTPAYATGYTAILLTPARNLRTESLSRAISLRFRRVRGASIYVILQTLGYATEQSEWTTLAHTTQCNITVPCEPAEIRSFKVYPIGKNGKGPDSAIVTALGNL